jgi:hypothetical protein
MGGEEERGSGADNPYKRGAGGSNPPAPTVLAGQRHAAILEKIVREPNGEPRLMVILPMADYAKPRVTRRPRARSCPAGLREGRLHRPARCPVLQGPVADRAGAWRSPDCVCGAGGRWRCCSRGTAAGHAGGPDPGPAGRLAEVVAGPVCRVRPANAPCGRGGSGDHARRICNSTSRRLA